MFFAKCSDKSTTYNIYSYVCNAKLLRGGNSPPQAGGFFMPKRIGMAVPFNEPFGKVISPLESLAALNEHRFLVL